MATHRIEGSLYTAIKQNNLSKAREAIEEDSSIVNNPFLTNHKPPLIFAVQWNRPDMVKLLLEKGADIDVLHEGSNALHTAIKKADNKTDMTKVVSKLLNNGIDTDSPDSSSKTPITLAASKKIPKIVKQLTDNGVDINQKDGDGKIALHYNLISQSYTMVKFLIKNGANPEIEDADGYNGFEYTDNRNIQEVMNNPLHTLLQDAIEDNDMKVTEKMEEINKLLENYKSKTYTGGNEEATNYKLMHTVINKIANGIPIFNIAEKLAKHEICLNAIDEDSNTPLTMATRLHQPEVINILTHYGVDINQKDKRGETPLHHSVRAEDFDMVEFLVENGANPEIENDEYFNAIEVCRDRELKEMLINLNATPRHPIADENVSESDEESEEIEEIDPNDLSELLIEIHNNSQPEINTEFGTPEPNNILGSDQTDAGFRVDELGTLGENCSEGSSSSG